MFVTRCDQCGKERGENISGWSKMSVYKRGNRPDLHLDLCPDCTSQVMQGLRVATGELSP